MGTKYVYLKCPKLGDVFTHTTASGWDEEATVVSVQRFKEVWKCVLYTSSEGTVTLSAGNQVRGDYDWRPKEPEAVPPRKRQGKVSPDIGTA